ncbi:uncharacterized protein LOC110866304 [Helianthus annuus]|uniref:uncharacterized protein LOC110866304 n=1 Tax=Helianthus annuus TaxID=4232 RepID=UPI001652FB69|nr:uncharacterized protein LOC110866304 [Helianthus annuus]
MFDDKDSLLDTWMYVLEDFGSERSALAKDKIYTHINLKQMTIIREAEAGLMDCKLDIIMSLHPLMQYIPLFILKWQGLQKKAHAVLIYGGQANASIVIFSWNEF